MLCLFFDGLDGLAIGELQDVQTLELALTLGAVDGVASSYAGCLGLVEIFDAAVIIFIGVFLYDRNVALEHFFRVLHKRRLAKGYNTCEISAVFFRNNIVLSYNCERYLRIVFYCIHLVAFLCAGKAGTAVVRGGEIVKHGQLQRQLALRQGNPAALFAFHKGYRFAPSPEALKYWLPVDWYNGGMEHTTLHLLYSRFWHKFLYDIGVVHTKEPYAKRTSHGMILGQNPHYVGNVSTQEEKDALIAKYGNQALRPAVKMSKSLGNVVNPDDVVKAYGADTMRLYIMFIGDFEKVATWSDDAVKGCKRFLDRVWNLAEMATADKAVSEKNEPIIHKTIKKVTDDIDTLKMNTAIAALMALVNDFYAKGLSKGAARLRR